MAVDNLSKRISDLTQYLEDLKTRGITEPSNTAEILSDAVDELQISLEELSTAEEELYRQNEDLIESKEALRESEERYRTLFESMTEGFALHEIICDEKGEPSDYRFININPAFERLTGLKREDVIGKTMLQVLPGNDPEWVEIYGRVAMTGEPVHFERYNTPLGKYYEVFAYSPKLCQFACVFVDITKRKGAEEALLEAKDHLEVRVRERTEELVKANETLQEEIAERKRAEEAVRAEQKRFNDVLETLPAYLVLLTPDYRVPFANRFFRERFGESHGRRCFEYLFGRTEPCEICETYKVLKTNAPRHWEWTGPDGRNYDIFDFPFKDTDGSPLIMEMGIDITERKCAEEMLIKAKETAEEAAKVKAAFMANMSHELRTPMNAVIGMTSLLLGTKLDDEQKDFVETIRTGGEALMTLISDILDFSRVEKEKVELEHQPLSLRTCIEESLDMVATQANEKGLNLSHTIKYGTPDMIIGDPGRLRQIMVNLLGNAVKFTDVGDVSVFASSTAAEDGRHQILFAVKDTGIGIPPEKMDKLFLPFGQLEMTISRKRDGAGLGLAISKGLVELMGGKIWAESKSGVGSTFFFTIPAEVAPSKCIRPDRTAEAVSENLAVLHPLRILVAEDNHLNQKMLLEMLRKMGYRADAVADGREVLQALERQPYDLIFMDIRMPEMDGITATKEICKRWPNACPKIIAITAYALAGDKEKCLNAGMDGYIAKPVQKDELAEVLKRYTLEAQ